MSEHPFHVSVCDITYNSDDQHLKISVRVFLDDLELTLRNHTGEPKLDIMVPERWEDVQHHTGQYLLKNLTISTTETPLDIKYIGSEIEVDVLWAYLEVKDLPTFDAMTVRFTNMLEIYSDQENLVHIRRDGVVRSLRLNEKKKEGVLKW